MALKKSKNALQRRFHAGFGVKIGWEIGEKLYQVSINALFWCHSGIQR
jgi:hypothetical protein